MEKYHPIRNIRAILYTWEICNITAKVNQKVSNLKTSIKACKSNLKLKEVELIHYLETLQSKHAFAPIHEASNNVVIICKKYHVEVVIRYVVVKLKNFVKR